MNILFHVSFYKFNQQQKQQLQYSSKVNGVVRNQVILLGNHANNCVI